MPSFPLSTLRHSAAHVLAQAVLAFYPDAKLGIGPAIDNGFYYDFDLSVSLSEDDLSKIEDKMREIIAENQSFSQYDLDRSKAEALIKDTGQSYKQELVDDLDLGDYSFYENGPFVDMCRGPHVDSTSQIGHIKLLKVAGAYWKGSEKNPMLQRIYGTAFPTQDELDTYLHRLEEAKKRDHRAIGKQMDLFSVQDEIGKGLILWHPKGARVRETIESFWKGEHFKNGYELLYTPHIGQGQLWETSGHLGFYDDAMFSAIDVEDSDYYVRPMNCPFHIKIYQNSPRSYRDLPLKWAELGTVYRFERSGVLHGLFRVRGFTQDDAHIFCTQEQMPGEIQSVLAFCMDILKAFGFDQYKIFVSTRPEEKYVGDLATWEAAETALKSACDGMDVDYEIDEGGGAFYGPKIDIKIEDAIGREWQCSTVQFDFNLPERFDLSYIGSDGAKHRPFMIHRALLGSIERFIGVLIEHFEGKFPVWLAPVQIKVLSLNKDVLDYSESIVQQFRDRGLRVELDASKEKLGYKIRQTQMEKVPYMLIVGRNEKENGEVSVRSRDHGDLGALSVGDFIEKIETEAKNRVISSGDPA